MRRSGTSRQRQTMNCQALWGACHIEAALVSVYLSCVAGATHLHTVNSISGSCALSIKRDRCQIVAI